MVRYVAVVFQTVNLELWSCVIVEVAVLGSPPLIILNIVSVEVKRH